MKFRIARHTLRLEPILQFYTGLLGLEVLAAFESHDGYDGIFIGKRGLDWHLEFTRTDGAELERHMDEDDLLVFYPEDRAELEQIRNRLGDAGLQPVQPKNPYWAANGVMYLDPDGYRIVVSPQKVKEDQSGKFTGTAGKNPS